MSNKYDNRGWSVNRKVIFLDLDGVLCDFDRQFKTHAISKDITLSSKNVSNLPAEWWESMPWTPWGKELYQYTYDRCYTCILTSHASEESAIGKIRWIKREIGNSDYMLASPKWAAGSPNSLLIDDTHKKISRFVMAGGRGHLFISSDINRCYECIDSFLKYP